MKSKVNLESMIIGTLWVTTTLLIILTFIVAHNKIQSYKIYPTPSHSFKMVVNSYQHDPIDLLPNEPDPVYPTTQLEWIGFYIDLIAPRYDLDPDLIRAVIWAESRFNPKCITNEAQGLMQVIPRWHEARMDKLSITDLLDPYSNILIGCDYLHELVAQTGSIPYALMIYNMGYSNAQKIYNKGETTAYVQEILRVQSELKEGKLCLKELTM